MARRGLTAMPLEERLASPRSLPVDALERAGRGRWCGIPRLCRAGRPNLVVWLDINAVSMVRRRVLRATAGVGVLPERQPCHAPTQVPRSRPITLKLNGIAPNADSRVR